MNITMMNIDYYHLTSVRMTTTTTTSTTNNCYNTTSAGIAATPAIASVGMANGINSGNSIIFHYEIIITTAIITRTTLLLPPLLVKI